MLHIYAVPYLLPNNGLISPPPLSLLLDEQIVTSTSFFHECTAICIIISYYSF